MSASLDSSVLIAALDPANPDFANCSSLLRRGDCVVHIHALNETFSTLTGGALKSRVPPDLAAELIRERVVDCAKIVVLEAADVLLAHREARTRGVRGGAIYDYLHLVAARKSSAEAIYTLNLSDFLAFRREGDPEVRRP